MTTEVIRNALVFAAEEMGVALRNSAYSPNIKERMDHSCALFDASGRLLAQAEHIPVHLGSLAWGMRNIVRGLEHVAQNPEDVFIVNDPYVTGTHLNDVTAIEPVFWHGTLVGYSVNKAHHVDVGGQTPGSLTITATELAQEGVVIPLTALIRSGQPVRETWDFLLANVRNPEITRGDLRAQLAAGALGRRRILELCGRYPLEVLLASWDRIIDRDEHAIRQMARCLPEGTYRAEDCLELPDGRLVWIRGALRADEGRVAVDFTGTDPQVKYAINAVFGVTVAAVLFALKAVLVGDLPMTEGLVRVVAITAPERTILNPQRPAAVGVGNTETSQRVADVVLRALADALPGRVTAAGCGSMNNVAVGGIHPGTGRSWTFYETIGGGSGGRPDRDGIDGIHVNMTNTMNTPVEAAELEFPMLFGTYQLRAGSGGRGRWRGGCGITRSWKLLGERATVTVLAERTIVPPWGLAGGDPGGLGSHAVIRRDGQIHRLPSKGTIELNHGDTLLIQTPGGGGYGDPRERSAELAGRDRQEELVVEAGTNTQVPQGGSLHEDSGP